MKRENMWYAVIGGIVGAIVTILVTTFSPLTTQHQLHNLGDITCTSLTVVDPKIGKGRIFLEQDSSAGAYITIVDEDDKHRIMLGSGVHAGFLDVSGNDKSMLRLGGDKDGGFLLLNDKHAKRRVGLAVEDREQVPGAVLEMFNKGDTRIFQVGASPNGGIALVWDNTGTTWAGPSANKATGALVIKDSAGNSSRFPSNY